MTIYTPLPHHSSLSVKECRQLSTAYAILHRLATKEPINIGDPTQAGELFRLRLAAMDREVFSVAFLSTRNEVIDVRDLFFGTVDGAEVHPRIIVQQALSLNAAALIVAHNHPSGNSEPSAADRAMTMRLKQALALVEIRLLDHIVVTARGTPVSLASRGWV